MFDKPFSARRRRGKRRRRKRKKRRTRKKRRKGKERRKRKKRRKGKKRRKRKKRSKTNKRRKRKKREGEREAGLTFVDLVNQHLLTSTNPTTELNHQNVAVLTRRTGSKNDSIVGSTKSRRWKFHDELGNCPTVTAVPDVWDAVFFLEVELVN